MDAAFITDFKKRTEAKWTAEGINPAVYGFQFQQGTRWNPGLSTSRITEYEQAVGAVFPDDFRTMLQHINGTDRPNLNVYGSCGEPHRTAFTLYAFPRDLPIVKEQMQVIQEDRDEIAEVLLECEQFNLPADATLVPVYSHRYMVCGSDRKESRVLSIAGSDVITYGLDLQSYLVREFLT